MLNACCHLVWDHASSAKLLPGLGAKPKNLSLYDVLRKVFIEDPFQV